MRSLFFLVLFASSPAMADAPNDLAEILARSLDQDGWPIDDAKATSSLARLCRSRQKLACDAKSWKSRSLAEIGELVSPKCEGGDPVACLVSGWAASQWIPGRPVADAPDGPAAHAAFNVACDGGVARACTELGKTYLLGIGVKADSATAKPLIAQGCEGGDDYGCTFLGTLGDPAMLKKAVSNGYAPAIWRAGAKANNTDQLTTACEAGVGDACAALAGDEPDPAWLDTACQAGHGPSCLAQSNYSLALEPPLEAPALDLAKAGCDALHGPSCDQAALLLIKDPQKPTPDDTAKALPYKRRACDLGSPGSCRTLGRRIWSGFGLPSNQADGLATLTQACGQLAAGNEVPEPDVDPCLELVGIASPDARRNTRKQCDTGGANACLAQAGIYLRESTHTEMNASTVTKSRAAAFADLKRACELGSRAACQLHVRHELGLPVLEVLVDEPVVKQSIEATYVATWDCFDSAADRDEGQVEEEDEEEDEDDKADEDGEEDEDEDEDGDDDEEDEEPTASFTANVRIELGADGVPTATHVDDIQASDTTKQCLQEALLTARFPAVERGQSATVGWELRYTEDSPNEVLAGTVRVRSASGRDGAPAAGAVRRALMTERIELRRCIEAHPPTADAWVMRIPFSGKVTRSGEFKGIKLSSSGSDALDTCLLGVLNTPREHGTFAFGAKVEGELRIPALPHLPHAKPE